MTMKRFLVEACVALILAASLFCIIHFILVPQ